MSNIVPDVRLLGPVQVLVDGRPVPLGHSRQRSVIAVLLLHANRVVSTGSLALKVWGPDAPPAARSSLYSYITRLRSALAAVDPAAVSIQRVGSGYLVRIEDDCIDERRVRAHIAAARASDDPETSARLYRRARLTRSGDPLEDVDSPWLAEMRDELEGLAAAALIEEHATLERLGRPAELLTELERLAARRPLDESVARAIMRALASVGRRADALRRFEALRSALREELGAFPDATSNRQYRELLDADGSISSAHGNAPAVIRPAQLPGDVSGFAGRSALAGELTKLLSAEPRRVLLHGPAGIGKTALGLHVCHRSLVHFPDGHIYLNLSGFRPGHAPVSADAALGHCLRTLGVRPADTPTDREEAASLLRSLLSGKRVLLFLDDVSDIDQVLPLLPGIGAAGVLATSRHRLPVLATHGVRHLELGSLQPAESLELLRRVVGSRRISAEPSAAAELSEACAHLPLALRLLAARAADRPLERLEGLARALQNGAGLFPMLSSEPGTRSPVETAFAMSYQALDPQLRLMFRVLANLPGADFSAETAQAAVGQPIPEVNSALYRLRAVHLLEEHVAGRFLFHDLIRLYGRQCATREDDPQVHAGTLLRTAHHYRGGAETANARHRLLLLRPPGTRATAEPPSGDASASRAMQTGEPGTLSWLEAEHANILATIRQTAAHHMHEPTWRLADAMRGFYRLRPHDPDWLRAAVRGLAAAEATSDPVAVAALNLALADAYQARSGILQSLEHDTRALAAARAARWREGEAAAASGIGRSQWSLGSLDEARSSLATALRLYEEAGNAPGVATTLGSIGRVHHDDGDWGGAQKAYLRSFAMSRKSGSRTGQALSLYYLGALRLETGSTATAISHFKTAQTLSRRSGLHQGDALATAHLAATYAMADDHGAARLQLSSADALASRVTDQRIAAEVLIHIGNALRHLGAPAAALAQHTRALQAARAATYPRGEVLALVASARDHAARAAVNEAERLASLAIDRAARNLPQHRLRARLVLAEVQALREPASGRRVSESILETLRLCREARLHMEVGLAEQSIFV